MTHITSTNNAPDQYPLNCEVQTTRHWFKMRPALTSSWLRIARPQSNILKSTSEARIHHVKIVKLTHHTRSTSMVVVVSSHCSAAQSDSSDSRHQVSHSNYASCELATAFALESCRGQCCCSFSLRGARCANGAD